MTRIRPCLHGLLLVLALLFAAPPAMAIEERPWEWSIVLGLNPESSEGKVVLLHPPSLPSAVPNSDLAYELSYGSSRAAIGTALRYQLFPRFRLEMDLSLLSLPLSRVRITNDGSRTLLESSLNSRARWGPTLTPASLTPAIANNPTNDGLAAVIYRNLLEGAGNPTDPEATDAILREAILKASDTPLREELFVSQSRQGDLIQLSLMLNMYYDILASYPYAIYIGAGAGVFWSRLDDPWFGVSNRVRSDGFIYIREGSTGIYNFPNSGSTRGTGNYAAPNLPDLEETRSAMGFYIGTRQYFSEKSAMNIRASYYLLEASDYRADSGDTEETTLRIGIDFLY